MLSAKRMASAVLVAILAVSPAWGLDPAEIIKRHRVAVGLADQELGPHKIVYQHKGTDLNFIWTVTRDGKGAMLNTFRLAEDSPIERPRDTSVLDGKFFRLDRETNQVRRCLSVEDDPSQQEHVIWGLAETGFTPLLSPYLGGPGMKVVSCEPVPDSGLIRIEIGVPGRVALRVLINEQTYLVSSIIKLYNLKEVGRVQMRDYVRQHGVQVPKRMVTRLGGQSEREWVLDSLEPVDEVDTSTFAPGRLPSRAERRRLKGPFMWSGTFTVGRSPQRIRNTDIDGDGHVDLVVAAAGRVTLMFNDGQGQFDDTLPLHAGKVQNTDAIPVDLNLDGLVDIVSASPLSPDDSVLYFENLGGGDFDTRVRSIVGDWPNSLAVIDADADGVPEVAAAHLYGRCLILGFNENKKLRNKKAIDLDDQHRAVKVGDFNNDRRPDLALMLKKRAAVALNQGNMEFQTHEFSLQHIAMSMAAEDFNGDGNLDLAIGHAAPPYGVVEVQVSVFAGQGDGTFKPMQTLAGPVGVNGMAAADFNGDGRIDLAAVSHQGHRVYVFPMGADGKFGKPIDIMADYGAYDVTAVELNDDGRPDLAIACETAGTVVTVLNQWNAPKTAAPTGPESK